MHIKICQCWNLSVSRIEEIFIEALCSCKTAENGVDGDLQPSQAGCWAQPVCSWTKPEVKD